MGCFFALYFWLSSTTKNISKHWKQVSCSTGSFHVSEMLEQLLIVHEWGSGTSPTKLYQSFIPAIPETPYNGGRQLPCKKKTTKANAGDFCAFKERVEDTSDNFCCQETKMSCLGWLNFGSKPIRMQSLPFGSTLLWRGAFCKARGSFSVCRFFWRCLLRVGLLGRFMYSEQLSKRTIEQKLDEEQ